VFVSVVVADKEEEKKKAVSMLAAGIGYRMKP